MIDDRENTMIQKPVLYVTGLSNFMAVLHQAVHVAKANNIDHIMMLRDVQQAGDLADKKRRLSYYFEVI